MALSSNSRSSGMAASISSLRPLCGWHSRAGAIDVRVKARAELVQAKHQEAVEDEPLHVGVGEELDLAVTHVPASP